MILWWKTVGFAVVLATLGCGSKGQSSTGRPPDGAAAICMSGFVQPTVIVSARAAAGDSVYATGQWTSRAAIKRGLLRSDDGGARFCPVSTPDPVVEAWPGPDGSLWAKTEVGGAMPVSLLRSTDAGRTWRDAWDPALGAPAAILGSAGANDLWAKVDDHAGTGSIVVTRDGGGKWTKVLPPDLNPTLNPPVFVVNSTATVDPGRAGRVYFSYFVYEPSGPRFKLVRTDDFGSSFEVMSVPDAIDLNQAVAIAIDGGGSLFLYATGKLWRSPDGGRTWSSVTSPTGASIVRAIAPGRKGHLLLVTDVPAAAWESIDSGASFQEVTFPGDRSRMRILVMGPNPGRFLTWTARGLEQTTDGGAKWNVLSASPAMANALTFAADAPSTLLAAGFGTLLRSEARERVFTTLQAPWRGPVVALLSAAPADLYAVTATEVYRSTDSGASWISVLTAQGSQIVKADAAPDGSTIAVATANRVQCSTDRGATWASFAINSSAAASPVRALAVDPVRPGHVLIGTFPSPSTPSSLAESVDGCADFIPIPTMYLFSSLVFLPRALLAATDATATAGASISRSEDQGRSWTPSADGLDLSYPGRTPTSLTVRMLGRGNGPLVALADSIVHVADAEGRTWRRLAMPASEPPPPGEAPSLKIQSIAATTAALDWISVLAPFDLSSGFPPLTTPVGLFDLRVVP